MPMPAADNNMHIPAGDEADPSESSLAQMVQMQGAQLLALEKRCAELEKRLAAGVDGNQQLSVDVDENLPTNEVGDGTNMRASRIKDVDSATYAFEASMWDAALLVYVHQTNFTDMVILLIGCVTNLTLQVFLLLTVSMDMLDNSYEEEKIQEMLTWRVETGHHLAVFDDSRGLSRLDKLCNNKLWAFEQDEYNKLYDYLYKPMPGFALSTLAIIMWILTIMKEYRRCVEQALAVYHLDSKDVVRGRELVTTEDDTMQIVGLSRMKKGLALVFLSLPRLGVMFSLAVIGSIYLAQTVSLQDIVLNAVGLAFVMDADELLADVMLTERLRSVVEKVEPMTCGKISRRDSKHLPYKDMLRYFITLGLIIAAVLIWLVPFQQHVESASLILCGGYQEFSYDGGIDTAPDIVLHPKTYGNDIWGSTCDPTMEELYLSLHYGATFNSSLALNISQPNYPAKRTQTVMNFALMQGNCGTGEVMAPQNEQTKAGTASRQCQKPPDVFTTVLASVPDVSIIPGGSHGYGECPRFNLSAGCFDSSLNMPPDPCIWSWMSMKCDGESAPGNTYTTLCSDSTDLNQMCDRWQFIFGQSDGSPTYNCRSRDYCDSPYKCLGMTFSLAVKVDDTSAWTSNTPDLSIQIEVARQVRMAVKQMLNVGLTAPNLISDNQVRAAEINVNGNTKRITYDVGVTELPYQIKPKQYLGGDEFVVAFNDLLAMNSWDVGLVATEAWLNTYSWGITTEASTAH